MISSTAVSLMFHSICLATLLVTACCINSHAQASSTQVEFDVASVKQNKDAGRALLQATPGRFAATDIPLQRLLLIAYDVEDFQIVGEPPWIASNRYDIIAKASDDTTVQQMEGPMLQNLLEERFKIRLHRETRLLPLYELVIAKRGPKLHPSDKGSCTPYMRDAKPAVAASSAETPLSFCGFRRTAEGLSRTLDGKGVSLAEFAANLSRSYNTVLGRNVVNRTGIAGTFDITLKWTNDPDSPSLSTDTASTASAADSPIFTALQEQLGSKLQQAKGPVDVLVIDHIEQRSSN